MDTLSPRASMNQMDLGHSKVIEKDVIFANRDGVKAWWSGAFSLGQNLHLF